jgi:P27 family predicted phage terminase small subunit
MGTGKKNTPSSDLFAPDANQGLNYDLDERKYTRLKASIKKYLTDKGLYEKFDLTMIEELIFNIRMSDEAKADIKARGFQVNVRASKTHPLYQTNQSVSIYQTACKQITSLSNRLGLSVDSREKLGLTEPKEAEGDELEEFN